MRLDTGSLWGPSASLPDEPPVYGEQRNAPIVSHRESSRKWKEDQMRVGAAFPSKFLKNEDLQGRAVNVTIKSVELEDVGDGEKPVVYFRQGKKGLVLNKTNAETIVDICGTDEMDDWAGHTIQLYPDKTSFQGKRVDCIRIREAAQEKPAAAAKPQQRRQPDPLPADTSGDSDDEPVFADDGRDDVPF